MQFVGPDRSFVSYEYVELYANPITREMFTRIEDVKDNSLTWFVRNNGGIVAADDTILEAERTKLMTQQRDRDSCENRCLVITAFWDTIHDIIPSIDFYLLACYPLRLEPVAIDTFISWLPDYDFTNVTRGFDVNRRIWLRGQLCASTDYGSCSFDDQTLRIFRCDGVIELFSDDGVDFPVPRLVIICIERIIAMKELEYDATK